MISLAAWETPFEAVDERKNVKQEQFSHVCLEDTSSRLAWQHEALNIDQVSAYKIAGSVASITRITLRLKFNYKRLFHYF